MPRDSREQQPFRMGNGRKVQVVRAAPPDPVYVALR
jgi:hypothetical protein